jgi:hypothetical protein
MPAKTDERDPLCESRVTENHRGEGKRNQQIKFLGGIVLVFDLLIIEVVMLCRAERVSMRCKLDMHVSI